MKYMCVVSVVFYKKRAACAFINILLLCLTDISQTGLKQHEGEVNNDPVCVFPLKVTL